MVSTAPNSNVIESIVFPVTHFTHSEGSQHAETPNGTTTIWGTVSAAPHGANRSPPPIVVEPFGVSAWAKPPMAAPLTPQHVWRQLSATLPSHQQHNIAHTCTDNTACPQLGFGRTALPSCRPAQTPVRGSRYMHIALPPISRAHARTRVWAHNLSAAHARTPGRGTSMRRELC